VRRDYLDLGFTLLLLALISWTTFEASKWDARARLFPWAAGIPVLVLLIVQIVRQVRTILASPDGPKVVIGGHADAHVAFERTLRVGAWILGFAVLIWAVGFPVGGTLGTLLYLKTAARERWPISLAITVGTGAFFWILITFLYTPFPRGFIVDLLPI
jgi:hypothetical protein